MPFEMSDFFRGLQASKAAVLAAARPAVEQFGAHVVGDAQEIAPVDTGALKASGTWAEAEITEEAITQEIGFNTDYAAAVHENLVAHHDQGEAKYLETPMREDAGKFGPFVAGKIREILK